MRCHQYVKPGRTESIDDVPDFDSHDSSDTVTCKRTLDEIAFDESEKRLKTSEDYNPNSITPVMSTRAMHQGPCVNQRSVQIQRLEEAWHYRSRAFHDRMHMIKGARDLLGHQELHRDIEALLTISFELNKLGARQR